MPKKREFDPQHLTKDAAWEAVCAKPRGVDEDVSIPGVGVRSVHILYLPAFGESGSWDIRERDGQLRVYASKVVVEDWKPKLVDYQRRKAPATELREYSRRLSSMVLPIDPRFEDGQGRDGETYVVTLFGGYRSQVRFQWWSEERPSQWEPLATLVREMIAAFQSWPPMPVKHPKNDVNG